MKLYLNVDQAKIIRTALYLEIQALEGALKDATKSSIIEQAESGIQEARRLVWQLNEEIEREER